MLGVLAYRAFVLIWQLQDIQTHAGQLDDGFEDNQSNATTCANPRASQV